jgi:uncharacterized membrane protein YphA (DoxX/SURF4 family)
MNVALLSVRLALAAILSVAGAAKLVDPAGTRETFEAFGLWRRISGPLAVFLPAAELAIAAALLFSRSARPAAAAAAALFAVFAAAIAAALAGGREPDCHCFGRLHSAPITARTAARALVLLAAAVFAALAGPGPSAVAWIGRLGVAEALAVTAIVLAVVFALANAAFSWQLLQQNGRLLRRLEELGGGATEWNGQAVPVGEPVPDVSVRRPDGTSVHLGALLDNEEGTLLVFTEPACGACGAVLDAVAHEQQAGRSILVVGVGDPHANARKAADHGVDEPYLQRDREIMTAFGLPGVPGAVYIDHDGRVASPPALGRDNVLGLLGATAGSRVGVAALP